MKISGTVMVCVVAVFVVGVGMLSGGGSDCRLSGFTRQGESVMEVTGVVECVGTTRSGKPAVELALSGDGLVGEKTVAYMRDSSCREFIRPGDTLMVEVMVKKVENFEDGFDYVEYMAAKGIFFVCFQNGGWAVRPSEWPELRYRVKRARSYCIAALRRIMNPLKIENSALLVAFLTGERENIGTDVLEDFKNSGLMHTLALSGLHVGIIYTILAFVFSVSGNYPASRKVRSVIVILCLWPYALLTGMSTSIFRAVLMATVYEGAVILDRERSTVNALALSALIVTLADTSAPLSLSFQLSFGAMLGISMFFRPLSSMVSASGVNREVAALAFIMKNERLPEGAGIPDGEWLGRVRGRKVAGDAGPDEEEDVGVFRRGVFLIWKMVRRSRKRIWDMCALSLSCQVVTVPIVWRVFGTFPVWSMLANLLCTPLVGGSMILFPVCAALRGVPFVGKWTFALLDRILDALRFCVGVMGTS